MYGVAGFAVIMLIGGIVGLLWFARPGISETENRTLTAFPPLTAESFMSGSFFTDLSLWYADTYPAREIMVNANLNMKKLNGVGTGTSMVGSNRQADEIPVEQTSGEAAPVAVAPADPPSERVVSKDIQDSIMEGVYVKDGAAYSIYYFSQTAADSYIAAMNKAAERLADKATVYSIFAPANSITLSDEEEVALGGSDQNLALDYLYTRCDSRVKPVRTVDIIKEHRDEYLFFHTDHHWTQLGAYYAYVAFCQAKGIEPKQLSDWKYVNLGDFEGSYYDVVASTGYVNPDYVEVYVPSGTNDLTYWDEDEGETRAPVIDEDATKFGTTTRTMTFIAGDRPLQIIENPTITDGSSCLVVKDSYGDMFVPMLVDHYQTVYVIDFRKTDKDLCDYVLENGIQDLIFMTGTKIGLADSAAATILSEVS